MVRILGSNDDRQIEWTVPALQRWLKDTCAAWKYEAYDAMIAALSIPGAEGNETTSQPRQIANYEFLFWRGGARMYGKIALRNNRVRILVLSAHRAERDKL